MRFMLIAFIAMSCFWGSPAFAGDSLLDHKALGEPQVEVNLSGSLFKFVAQAAGEDEPELQQFLSGLSGLYVRIYNRDQIAAAIEDVTRDLQRNLNRDGWETLARIKEENSNIGVYVAADEEIIEELAIVISSGPTEQQQLVLVNIAGNIDLAQLSKLGKVAGVDLDLPDLNPMKSLPTREQQKQIEHHRQQAMQALSDGNAEAAITQLKQIAMIGGETPEDLSWLALLYQQQGDPGLAYYYLGRTYEAQHHAAVAKKFYEHARKLDPDNPLVRERLAQ